MDFAAQPSIASEAPSVSAPIGAGSIPTEVPERKIISLRKIRETIGYYPHAMQRKALDLMAEPDCQFLTIPGGKRVGKTILLSDRGLAELHIPQTKTWIVAPSYDLGHRIWDYLELWANLHFPYLRATTKNNQPQIENAENGAWLKIKTADSKENLKGEALSLLLVDEGPEMDDDIWYQYLQPNVRQQWRMPNGKFKKPQSVFIGNPQGKNWFHEMFLRGGTVEGYYALHMPTAVTNAEGEIIGSNNPEWMTVEELRKIREETPEHIWKSDYLAEFRQEEGNIFQNLKRIQRGKLQKFNPRHTYRIGWDPAKTVDWSVITVIDTVTNEVVAFNRSQKLDYVFQKEKVKFYFRAFGGAKVIMDTTGIGEALYDELVRSGIRVEGYKFTEQSKKDLIEKLALFIEHGRISVPPELKDIYTELEIFGITDRNGKLKYEAPRGKHDDCVMSLALAVWELTGEAKGDVGIQQDSFHVEQTRRRVRQNVYL